MWSISGTRPHVSHGNVLGVVAPGFRQQFRGPDGGSPKRRRDVAIFVMPTLPTWFVKVLYFRRMLDRESQESQEYSSPARAENNTG